MDDCELCDDGDLNPEIVKTKTLVKGTLYEEYMADVRKNESNGKDDSNTLTSMNKEGNKSK